ncbi:MAG: Crp/Fnr family transcriptional regulator [Gammaproteobacteria bacterium]
MTNKSSGNIRPRTPPLTQCAVCPVRKRALFEGVPEEHLNWTQQFRLNQLVVPAKQDYLHEGSESDSVYTLFSGWSILYKTLPSGKRQILRFALPGDLIGFQHNLRSPMQYSAQALTESVYCAFPRARMGEMLSERPELATRLALMNARDTALCHQHLLGTGRKTAKERVAFLLLELYHRVMSLADIMPDAVDDDAIEFPVAQEEIGDAVGLTTVHVNRTLRELRDEGLVACSHRRLRILDDARMSEIGQFDKGVVLSHPLL